MSLLNPNKLQPKGLNSYEVDPAKRILRVLDAAVEHVVLGAQRHQYGYKPVSNTIFTRVGEDAIQSYTPPAMPGKPPAARENDVISMMMGPKLAYYENKRGAATGNEVIQDTAAAVAAARQGVNDAYTPEAA